jgi:hypothetical protein
MHLALPQNGDVVVSHPTATIEHSISVVPERPHMTCATHDQAIASGRELAEKLQVDVWLTEDLCHFLLIASFRSVPPNDEEHGRARPHDAGHPSTDVVFPSRG